MLYVSRVGCVYVCRYVCTGNDIDAFKAWALSLERDAAGKYGIFDKILQA